MEGSLMFKLDDLKIGRRSWVKTAAIPTRRIGWTLEDCTKAPEKVLAAADKWIGAVRDGKIILNEGGEHCGRGILFYGVPGQGKSTVALAILQEMLTTLPLASFVPSESNVLVRPCYFTTYSNLLVLKGDLMDADYDESKKVLYDGILGEAKDDAYNVRVLVIDDIGKEHTTLSGWQSNMLHHILRTRFDNGLPTIVTTNIAREDWSDIYGDATGSFIKESFIYVPIDSDNDLR